MCVLGIEGSSRGGATLVGLVVVPLQLVHCDARCGVWHNIEITGTDDWEKTFV